MGVAEGMQTVVDEIKKSKKDRRDYEKAHLEREEGRQEEGEEQRKEREGFVNDLIAQDKDRLKEAKQLLLSRKKEVKHIFNEVNTFLGEVSEEMHEANRIWHSLSKSVKHTGSTNGKASAKHSKKKKKKK